MEEREPTHSCTDELVELLRAEDRDAQRLLVMRLSPWLRREIATLHRRCFRRACMSAEDIEGESWLRFLKPGTLDRFRSTGPHSLRRFLLGIVRNVIASAHDRARRDGQLFGPTGAERPFVGAKSDDGEERPDGSEPGPAALALAADLARSMLDDLATKERLVFSFLVEQGFGPRELAHELGCSDAGARGVVFRLRRRLGGWLGGE